MSAYVLDTSAFLAYLWREPGGDQIAKVLYEETAVMSAVNVAEVIAKVINRGLPVTSAEEFLMTLDFEHVAFDTNMALRTALLQPVTSPRGLSLGDRAYLALAQSRNAVALTADKSWLALDIGVRIDCIR
jgi:Uncharacterized protein conserved in bacteria